MKPCEDRDCRDGIYKKIEDELRLVYDKIDSKVKDVYRCFNHYMKKPNIAVVCVLLAFLLGSICGTIYNFYKIYYMAELVPKVEAGEKEIKEKYYQIEKDHTILESAIKQMVLVQDKLAVTIDKQQDAIHKNQKAITDNQKLLIEVITKQTNEIERAKETDKQLIRELRRRQP